MRRIFLLLIAVLASLYWYPSASFAAAASQFENGEVNVSFRGAPTTSRTCPGQPGLPGHTLDITYLVEPAQLEGGLLHLEICATGFELTGTFVLTTQDGATLSGTAEGRVVRDDVPLTPIAMTMTVREGTGDLSRLRGDLAVDALWDFDPFLERGGWIEGTMIGTLETAPK